MIDSTKLALIDSTAYKMNALMKHIIRATIDQSVTPAELIGLIEQHKKQTELFSSLLSSIPPKNIDYVRESVLDTINSSDVQLTEDEKDFMLTHLPKGLFG